MESLHDKLKQTFEVILQTEGAFKSSVTTCADMAHFAFHCSSHLAVNKVTCTYKWGKLTWRRWSKPCRWADMDALFIRAVYHVGILGCRWKQQQGENGALQTLDQQRDSFLYEKLFSHFQVEVCGMRI